MRCTNDIRQYQTVTKKKQAKIITVQNAFLNDSPVAMKKHVSTWRLLACINKIFRSIHRLIKQEKNNETVVVCGLSVVSFLQPQKMNHQTNLYKVCDQWHIAFTKLVHAFV